MTVEPVPGPVRIELSVAGDQPAENVTVRIGPRYCHTGADGLAIFEGIPAGKHTLEITDIRYRPLTQELDLPDGKRAPVKIELLPVRFRAIEGTVLDATDGQPVAATEIKMVPTNVPSLLKGATRFYSNWDGTFLLRHVPLGTYETKIHAAGYEELRSTTEVKGEKKQQSLTYKLSRSATAGQLTVRVLDGITGEPVPGATIEVQECYGTKRIGKATTDDRGMAALTGLRIGLRNRPAAATDKPLPVVPPAASIRVKAVGYHPGVSAVRLSRQSTMDVRLNPLREVAEREPNNDIATAQKIEIGDTYLFTISERGDHDWAVFRMTVPGRVRFSSPAHPLEHHVSLVNVDGKVLRNHPYPTNRAGAFEYDLTPGRYFIDCSEWGNNGSHPDPIKLVLSARQIDDPGEPDESHRTAVPIEPGAWNSTVIFPTRDEDWTSFEISRRSMIRIKLQSPQTMEGQLTLTDGSGKQIRTLASRVGQSTQCNVTVDPGRYCIRVGEWGNNGCGFEPVRFQVEAIPTDWVPSDTQDIRLVDLNVLHSTTIYPGRDQNPYALSVPGKGWLELRHTGPLETHLAVANSAGKTISKIGVRANRLGHHRLAFDGPDMLTLNLTEWGDRYCHPSPAYLWAEFRPADETDTLGDEHFRSATVLEPGQRHRGTILPTGDHDWFQIPVDHPGTLRFQLTCPLEMKVYLFSADGQTLRGRQAWPAGGPHHVSWDLLPGIYYVKLTEWGNNGQHTADYAFKSELLRADPRERVPLQSDPPRQLPLNRAVPLTIEQKGDVDTFVFTIPKEGPFRIHTHMPLEPHFTIVDDRNGKVVLRQGNRVGRQTLAMKAPGPMRYRMEVGEWGNNASDIVPGFIMVATGEQALPAARVTATVPPTNPTRVTFRSRTLDNSAPIKAIKIDPAGTGTFSVTLPPNGSAIAELPKQGIYCARARITGEDGTEAETYCWVNAVAQHERKGVHVNIASPMDGQTITEEIDVRASAVSYEGARIQSMVARVDGVRHAVVFRTPYQIQIPWDRIAPGPHTLSVTATDTRGNEKTVERDIRLSEYFNLLPRDGASRTGQTIRVSWFNSRFGAS
jgi:hypothetical protein